MNEFALRKEIGVTGAEYAEMSEFKKAFYIAVINAQQESIKKQMTKAKAKTKRVR